jgi:hypothetical protein
VKVDKVKCPQEVQDFLTRRVEMEAFNSSSSLRGLSDAAFQKRVRGQRCAIVGNRCASLLTLSVDGYIRLL